MPSAFSQPYNSSQSGEDLPGRVVVSTSTPAELSSESRFSGASTPGGPSKSPPILPIIALTSFLGTFLFSSVNIALPSIGKQYALSPVMLSWVVTAFLLSTAMFLLPVGRWADLTGIRKVYKIGLVIFTLTTFLIPLSVSGIWLIVFRFMQGIGAAFMNTTGQAILVSSYPLQKRGRVLGISVSATYMGLAMGPFVGGYLTQYAGWTTIFWLSGILGIVAGIIAFRLLGSDGENEDLKQVLVVTSSSKAKPFFSESLSSKLPDSENTTVTTSSPESLSSKLPDSDSNSRNYNYKKKNGSMKRITSFSQMPDLKGVAFYVAGLTALVYGSSQIPGAGGWALMSAGLIALYVFIRIENKSKSPVIDTRLFTRNRLFAYSNLAALINYSATTAIVFFLSLYLQQVQEFEPRVAGLILVVQPLMMSLFSPLVGRLSEKIEPHYLATAGMAMCSVGLIAFSFLGEHTSVTIIVLILIWEGIGFALFSSPNMNTIMSSVDKKNLGIASGTAASMRVLGQIVSMTVVTLLFSLIFGEKLMQEVTNDQFLKAMKGGFIIFAALGLTGIYFSWTRKKLEMLNVK